MKVDVNYEEVKPVVLPIRDITITLTKEEALSLMIFCGAVAGTGEIRNVTDGIYYALAKIGGAFNADSKEYEKKAKNSNGVFLCLGD